MKQFKKMLYIEDVPLSVWLQSHPNLLNDIQIPKYINRFLSINASKDITLTFWGNFKRKPKFNWNEKIVCSLRGQETFRFVSFIYKQEMYSGVNYNWSPEYIPVDLFSTVGQF